MTTDLTQEDKYRKQAENLLRKMAQARALFVRHKPSVVSSPEDIEKAIAE